MATFTFTAGDLSGDGGCSAAASVEADSLFQAKEKLLEAFIEIGDSGGVEGVLLVYDDNGVRMHVRVPPALVKDDDNWENDDE